jgi:chloramphenicol 3-O-phosphotransferase
VGLGSSAHGFLEERKAAEYATLIQVSHPRRLPSAVRHRPRVRTQARIARPGAGVLGQPRITRRPGARGDETVIMSAAVWLVTGAQASGKSTIAEVLSSRFERGVHLRGGQFYRWATRGWVHAGDIEHPDDARRLLDLRYRLSALVADEYCDAGFTTVVQDNIFGADVTAWLRAVGARPRHLVVLRPSVEVIERREAARTTATGKVAYRPGEFTIDDLDDAVAQTSRIGLWLDTSLQTPDDTVTEIVSRSAEANVEQHL